jgi:flagellar hook-associated protein 2
MQMSGSVSSLGSSQISSQISAVEARLQKPITLLQGEAATDKADISAWGVIQGSISTLSGSLSGIADVASINVRSASTTLPSIATATASNTAQTGQYDLTNIALAKTQEIYSSLQGPATATVGSGTLTFTLKSGKTETVTVGSGSSTLNGIAQAINKVAGGVKASIVGSAGGARLVLQGSSTGSSQAFSVAGTGALATFDYSSATPAAGTDGSWTNTQTASNASLKINGVPITSTTNSVSSAVSGVSISLVSSGNTELTVGSAPGAIANEVSTVATNLNAAIAAIAKETAFVPASTSSASASSAKSGPLLGNFTASDLSSQLLSAVSGAAASGVSANAIGLTVSSTGAVSFNSSTFATAYAANPTGVAALVTKIYKNLDTVSSNALGSAATTASSATTTATATTTTGKGSIAAQIAALQTNVTSLNSSATAISKNNAAQLQILLSEYTVAEAAQTSASTSQAYLNIFTAASSGSTSKG